jgi:hypothetical protein
MNLDFAVLLMRSSYNAVDAIDVVPMNQFQKDFFLIRQAEYQYYANALGPGAMQQGDLADPNYFDFISFAQYETICREVNDPALIFEEQQPVEVGEGQPQQFNTVVVKRDSTLTTKQLAQKHTEIVGSVILDKLNEKFGATSSAIPKIDANSRPDSATLLASIKQMVNLFIVSGFAFGGSASISKPGKGEIDAAETEFTIVATSPATLWSGQALKVSEHSIIFQLLLLSYYCTHFDLQPKGEKCNSDKRLFVEDCKSVGVSRWIQCCEIFCELFEQSGDNLVDNKLGLMEMILSFISESITQV